MQTGFQSTLKEHLFRIKMIPNLSRFVQYLSKKSSGKIIIGVKQEAPPAATANATADAIHTTKNVNANADAIHTQIANANTTADSKIPLPANTNAIHKP